MPKGSVGVKHLVVKRLIKGCEGAGMKVGRVVVDGSKITVFPASDPTEPQAPQTGAKDEWDKAIAETPISVR